MILRDWLDAGMPINVIVNCDCLIAMKHMADGRVDAVIADIPYGTTACSWDVVIPFAPMWEQLKRITKKNGAIVLFGSQPFTSALIMSNPEMFKYEWVWDKTTGMGYLDSKFRPLKSHENILVFSRAGCSNGSKPPMIYNPQGLIKTNKQNRHTTSKLLHSQPKERQKLNTTHTNYPKSIIIQSRETGIHPTQKPVALIEYLIRTYTNEGNTVLDFTIGSGTTAIAAIRTNRHFIGFEIDEEYCKIAEKRIALERQQERLAL